MGDLPKARNCSRMRVRISLAALLVKVIAKICLNLEGVGLESNNFKYSLVSAYVLPEPAEALNILKCELSNKIFSRKLRIPKLNLTRIYRNIYVKTRIFTGSKILITKHSYHGF